MNLEADSPETDPAEVTRELSEIVNRMDDTERVVLWHTLNLMDEAKTGGWRTRRLNEFVRWFKERRAAA